MTHIIAYEESLRYNLNSLKTLHICMIPANRIYP